MNKFKVMLFSGVGVLVLVVVLLFYNACNKDKSNESNVVDFNKDQETKFSYKDLMDEEHGKYFEGEKNENPYPEKEKDFNSMLEQLNKKDSTGSNNVYENENQEMVKQIESEIQRIATENKSTTQNKSTDKQNQITTNATNAKNVIATKQDKESNVEIEDKKEKRRSDQLKKGAGIKSTSETIAGVIDNGNRGIRNGETIRMRITQDCFINGVSVKENTTIAGIADLSNERLNIIIKEINADGVFIKCDMAVYDNDGVKGLYVPGARFSKTAKTDVANEVLNDQEKYVEVPVVGKVSTNILRKKVQDPIIKVYDNHKIILKSNPL